MAKRKRVKVHVRSVRPGGGGAAGDRKRERRCGRCTGCCSSLSVIELNKPEWTHCEHLSGSDGCRIYSDRPDSCAGFRCLWLNGLSTTREGDRPDRSGIILVQTYDRRMVQARELWPGASSSGAGLDLITRLRRAQVDVVVVNPEGQRTLARLTLFGSPIAGRL